MKRLIMNFKGLLIAVTVFASFWSPVASAQSGFFCTTNTVPITFKIDNFLAGFTGNAEDTNVSFGYKALTSSNILTGAYANVAIGVEALSNNTSGSFNIANGFQALYNNTSGSWNTANGFLALYSNTTGDENTATGLLALYSNDTGNNNTANGAYALYSNTEGSNNTATGYQALGWNMSGYNNTANGYQALNNNQTGSENTANGYQALNNNTSGYNNTATGSLALYSNTWGNKNTATGTNALYLNTTGYSNSATGHQALYFNKTGYANTANGYQSLFSSETGSYNTAIGAFSLSNTTGSYNTAMGAYALDNTSGSYNTAIGYDTNTGYRNNATAIGNGATATASDQVVLGNTTVTSILGYNSLTITSDGRIKKNIRAEVPGLAFVKQLQPVMYNMNLDALDELLKSEDPKINAHRDSIRNARSPEQKEIEAKSRAKKEAIVYSGFIAQDVEAAAQSIGYDFSGVDAPENGKGAYGLRYAEFVVPLVKAVQELSEQNDQLQEQVNELTGLLYRLLEKDSDLKDIPRSESKDAADTGLPELTDSGASLQQNIPNPFNQSTVIRYTLPQTCKSAKIVISNASSGGIIRQIPLPAGSGGEDSITIEAGSLSAGIYNYSLYVDNKLIDTKKMLLTEK